MSQDPANRSRTHAVASKANAAFKSVRALTTSQGIRAAREALLAGEKLVREALAESGRALSFVVRDGRRDEMLAPYGGACGLPVLELATELFNEVDVVGTGGAQLVVRTPEIAPWSFTAPWPRGCTLFVGFQNPENVGAVLRSAAAFGVARAVLLKGTANPFLPRSLRASSAAAFRVPLLAGPTFAELVTYALATGPAAVPLVTLDADGADITSEPFPATFGLVPGVEGPGLPADAPSHWRRRIPMQPGVESLNATVATAIALYAWRASLTER